MIDFCTPIFRDGYGARWVLSTVHGMAVATNGSLPSFSLWHLYSVHSAKSGSACMIQAFVSTSGFGLTLLTSKGEGGRQRPLEAATCASKSFMTSLGPTETERPANQVTKYMSVAM